MVVLEAAAIGAASYGLYKGGEAGVNKGKECHREMQREKKRASQRSSLREKTKHRTSRIAEIMQMKEGVLGSNSTASSNASSSFAERQLAEKEASSDVNDRHRAVMAKLRSSRKEESKKGSKKLSLNPFKKK